MNPQDVQTDRNGRPLLKDGASKLVTLERRREFLQESLEKRIGPGSGRSREFAKQECAALGTAIVALRFHFDVVQGLDTPISALRELVDAYDGPAADEGRLRAAVRRARGVVEEFEALMRAKGSET